LLKYVASSAYLQENKHYIVLINAYLTNVGLVFLSEINWLKNHSSRSAVRIYYYYYNVVTNVSWMFFAEGASYMHLGYRQRLG